LPITRCSACHEDVFFAKHVTTVIHTCKKKDDRLKPNLNVPHWTSNGMNVFPYVRPHSDLKDDTFRDVNIIEFIDIRKCPPNRNGH